MSVHGIIDKTTGKILPQFIPGVGGAQNLQQVLTTGNDAGALNITNLNQLGTPNIVSAGALAIHPTTTCTTTCIDYVVNNSGTNTVTSGADVTISSSTGNAALVSDLGFAALTGKTDVIVDCNTGLAKLYSANGTAMVTAPGLVTVSSTAGNALVSATGTSTVTSAGTATLSSTAGNTQVSAFGTSTVTSAGTATLSSTAGNALVSATGTSTVTSASTATLSSTAGNAVVSGSSTTQLSSNTGDITVTSSLANVNITSNAGNTIVNANDLRLHRPAVPTLAWQSQTGESCFSAPFLSGNSGVYFIAAGTAINNGALYTQAFTFQPQGWGTISVAQPIYLKLTYSFSFTFTGTQHITFYGNIVSNAVTTYGQLYSPALLGILEPVNTDTNVSHTLIDYIKLSNFDFTVPSTINLIFGSVVGNTTAGNSRGALTVELVTNMNAFF